MHWIWIFVYGILAVFTDSLSDDDLETLALIISVRTFEQSNQKCVY